VIDLRRPVRGTIDSLFGGDRFPEEQYDTPAGDPGLFGPDSVTWRVHADVSMFVGGIAALLLQSLHPRAAAVVASSSRFREEPLHRLSRTASFVGVTTYGPTQVAHAVIERVRGVHDRIPGASDPDLLTWVHVAEVASFLGAYRRYTVVPVDADHYFDENAVVAELLGATGVPRSSAAVDDYFERMRPELGPSDASREMVAFLHRPLGNDPVTRSVYSLFLRAAMAQLPAWARELHEWSAPPGADLLGLRPLTGATLQGIRFALGTSPILRAARARAAETPSAARPSASLVTNAPQRPGEIRR
jgi:uncharacterized protein (DUF2236 family)